MHALINRPRGIVAVRNNTEANQIIHGLNAAFASFRDHNNQRLGQLETALDGVNSRMEALRVGGEGFDLPGNSAERRRAVQNLGRFGRTGRVEDLHEGFQVNAAMSTDSSPDGGVLAPTELAGEIMRIQRNDSAMRRLARVVVTSRGDFQQPFSLNNAGSGWVGEKQARPATDGPKLAMVDIPSGEVYANPAITQRLLDDSAFDLGAFIAMEIGDAFTAQEGAAFISGDGINKPRGFLTYDIVAEADATRAFGKLQYTPTGAASDFHTEDPADCLIDLVFSLKAKYRQNASWLMNSATLAKIAKFKDDQDQYIYQRSLVEGTPDRLLGYPVEIDEDMSGVGTNAYPVAFGDFSSGYIITDRTGMNVLRDPFTNKPFVMFYTTKRVGGAVLDSNAIKLLKCASS